jgi:hypothetical protein
LNHAPFLKLISQERRNGRMVDVDSVCVCRCGEKFPSDRQLKTHIYEPFGPGPESPQATGPQLPALAV